MKTGIRVVLALLALTAASCKQEGQPAASKIEASLEASFRAAEQAVREGETEKALGLFEAGLREAGDRPERLGFFAHTLFALRRLDRLPEAQERFLAQGSADTELARATFGIIEEALESQTNYVALVEWSDRLLALDWPSDLLAAYYRVRFYALENAGRFEQALDELPNVVRRLATAAPSIIEQFAFRLVDQPDSDRADRLIERLQREFTTDAEIQSIALDARIRLNLRRGVWSIDLLPDAIRQLEDGRLARLADQWFRALRDAGQHASFKQLYEWMLAETASKPSAWHTAARWSMIAANAEQDPALAANRFRAIIGTDLGRSAVGEYVHFLYPHVIQKAEKDELLAILAAVKPLIPELRSEGERIAVFNALFDAAFQAAAYDFMLELLRRGIPGRDAAWHTAMQAKVQAHQALDAGRLQDAIPHFQAFLKYLAAQTEDPMDPLTQTPVVRERILGLNAKRIGDLLATTGRNQEAQVAYREARSYYQAALKRLPEGGEEHRAVLAELNALPAPASR